MAEKNQETVYTQLPSLIHRVGREQVQQAQQICRMYGGVLRRVRRSRNWQLIANQESLFEIKQTMESKHPDSMRYIVLKLDDKLREIGPPPKSLEEQLEQLIVDNPNITLAELMQNTDCSIAEARTARFLADI